MPDLTPEAIADWYRSQIQKYQRLLEMHEAEFPSVQTHRVRTRARQQVDGTYNGNAVDAAAIRAYVAKNNGRVNDLAKHFHVDVEIIKAIVDDPANGLNTRDRGWVRLNPGQEAFLQ